MIPLVMLTKIQTCSMHYIAQMHFIAGKNYDSAKNTFGIVFVKGKNIVCLFFYILLVLFYFSQD